MRKIWIIFPLGIVVAISIIGYFGYRFVADTVMLPDELEPYESDHKALALITSRKPAPEPDARLTATHVKLFMAMLDSINIGADHLNHAVADLAIDTTKNGRVKANILAAPGVVHHALLAGPVTRRAIVNFLNEHELSWAEYQWMRDRILVASGITSADADSAASVNLTTEAQAVGYMMEGALDSTLNAAGAGEEESDSFGADTAEHFDKYVIGEHYGYLDELRSRITVAPAEAALVAPHRALLLKRGLRCMTGTDDEF